MKLYDYTTDDTIEVDADTIDDDLARRLIPQDEETQFQYHAFRSYGESPIYAMTSALLGKAGLK